MSQFLITPIKYQNLMRTKFINFQAKISCLYILEYKIISYNIFNIILRYYKHAIHFFTFAGCMVKYKASTTTYDDVKIIL
jgi:hypothetical protein